MGERGFNYTHTEDQERGRFESHMEGVTQEQVVHMLLADNGVKLEKQDDGSTNVHISHPKWLRDVCEVNVSDDKGKVKVIGPIHFITNHAMRRVYDMFHLLVNKGLPSQLDAKEA